MMTQERIHEFASKNRTQSPKVGAVGLEKNKPTLDSNSKTSYQKNVFK